MTKQNTANELEDIRSIVLQAIMEAIADLEGYVFHEMQLDEMAPMLQLRANIYIIRLEMEPDELEENTYPAIDSLINLWHVVGQLGGELGRSFREYQNYLENSLNPDE